MILLLSFFLSFSLYASECHLLKEQYRIKTIHVANKKEFYYCLGKLHGKDRAFQLFFFKQMVKGKLSEYLGFDFLKSDLQMRLLNLPAVASEYSQKTTKHFNQMAYTYSQGVNQGIKENDSLELKELGITSFTWSKADILNLILLQSFDQTKKSFYQFIKEEMALAKVPHLANYHNKDVPWFHSILPLTENKALTQTKRELHRLEPFFTRTFYEDLFGGSNNWVEVDQKGNAYFANDPHLSLYTPSFWYWSAFKSDTFSLFGSSVPGIPVIASGTNKKVAWGLTNSYYNTYKVSYIKDSKLKTFTPLVWIKFGPIKLPFFFKTFKHLNKKYPALPLGNPPKGYSVVINWSGFHLDPKKFDALFDLNFSTDVFSGIEKLKKVPFPSWNFVLADTKGNIAYQLVGKTLYHKEAIPLGIQKSSVKDFLKMSFNQNNLSLINPENKQIITANNAQIRSSKIGRAHTQSFRAFAIKNKLTEVSIKRYQETQCDSRVNDAEFFIPILLTYFTKYKIKTKLIELFKDWDFSGGLDCQACASYRYLMDQLKREFHIDENVLYHLLKERKSLVLGELKKAITFSENHFFRDGQPISWGELHFALFPHMAKKDAWNFSPKLPTPGDQHSISPGQAKYLAENNMFEHFSGASQRIIVKLSHPFEIHYSIPALNTNYYQINKFNPFRDWVNCRYHKFEL